MFIEGCDGATVTVPLEQLQPLPAKTEPADNREANPRTPTENPNRMIKSPTVSKPEASPKHFGENMLNNHVQRRMSRIRETQRPDVCSRDSASTATPTDQIDDFKRRIRWNQQTRRERNFDRTALAVGKNARQSDLSDALAISNQENVENGNEVGRRCGEANIEAQSHDVGANF